MKTKTVFLDVKRHISIIERKYAVRHNPVFCITGFEKIAEVPSDKFSAIFLLIHITNQNRGIDLIDLIDKFQEVVDQAISSNLIPSLVNNYTHTERKILQQKAFNLDENNEKFLMRYLSTYDKYSSRFDMNLAAILKAIL